MKLRIIMLATFALFAMSACGQKGELQKTADAPPPHMEQSSGK